MRPRPDAMRPRSRPERVRPRMRPNDLASRPHGPQHPCSLNKKLSCRRGTTRCVVSVEILPIATQQYETTCTTSPEQIEVMKLEGYTYSGPMCNKHVHSTTTRSSRFHCLIGVINKPATDRVVDITCIPTTCCGEIF